MIFGGLPIDAAKTSPSWWVAILVENDTYPQDVRVRNEAETLVQAGFRVTVVAPRERGQPRFEAIGGVEVIRFWLPSTAQTSIGFAAEYLVAHVQLAWRTVSLLCRGIDVLHICNPPDTIGLLLLAARLFRRGAVFDNHDLFPELFELRYGYRRVTAILRAFQRAAFRYADVVLTTNESQRTVVLDAVRRPPESVVVVRNGPRRETLASTTPISRPLAKETVDLLFLGALEPQDGVVALADVLQLLVHFYGLSPRLTVVGEGSCKSELADACARLGLADRLELTGRVPHDEVASRLAEADICLDPAPCNKLNHASTMMKIAEYMAAQKPIVAFELRETKQTAGDGALYAPCGDVNAFAARIAELAVDPHLIAAVVKRGRERITELVWERSAEPLVSAYRRLTTSHATSRRSTR